MVPRCHRYTKSVCSNDMKIDEKLSWNEGTSGSREEKRGDNGGTGVGGRCSKYDTRVHAKGLVQLCMIK